MCQDFLSFQGWIIFHFVYVCIYRYITFCLSSFLLTNIWGAFTSWVLYIMLQWIKKCKYLFKILLSIILIKYSEVGLMVVLFWNFWGTTILSSIAVEPFYNLTNRAQGFQFLHIIINTCYLGFFFNSSHPNGCEKILHCSFDLYFPDA